LSHAWIRTWWECFGTRKKLRVILVRSGRNLIAAAPLMLTTGWNYGIRIRRLESIYNYHTPRFDFPIVEHHDEAYGIIWKMITAADDWDAVSLAQVPEDSPTLAAMEKLGSADGCFSGVWIPSPSPVIGLSDYETVLNRVKGKE